MVATTFQNNRAEGGDDPFLEYQAEGGGAWIGGDGEFFGGERILGPEAAAISQSTFSGNVAKVRSYRNDTFARGGGIFFSSAYQGIEHSTVSGNEALGELASLGVAGGIFAEYSEGNLGCPAPPAGLPG